MDILNYFKNNLSALLVSLMILCFFGNLIFSSIKKKRTLKLKGN